MGTTINGAYVGGKHERRKRAFKRLELQLKSGKKTVKDGTTVPLTDHDKERITKEMEILSKHI